MTPADLDRFRKMLGMLGSDHAGERSAAALKCTALLKSAGLTWSSVSLPVEQPDVLAQRRETMGKNFRQSSDDSMRDFQQGMSEFEKAIQAEKTAKAARRAAWKERSYGVDSDGFEPGRK